MIQNALKQFGSATFIYLFPVVAFAQNSVDLTYFDDAVVSLGALVDQLIPLVIGLGLLFFIWGIVQFILASGDEGAKEVGKRRMVWGILALFVIVAVWGIVDLLAEMSGVEVGGNITAPGVVQ